MRAVLMILFVGSGCVHTPEAVPEMDASFDRDAEIDAGEFDAAPADAGIYEYSQPVLVAELNTDGEERSPVLTDDGLAIYFARSERIDGFSVNVPYRSSRASVSQTFAAPTIAASFGTTSINDFEINNAEFEWHFWIGLGQLAVSTRPSKSNDWSDLETLGIDGFSPSLSSDGLSLYTLNFDGEVIVRRRSTRFGMWGMPSLVPIYSLERIESIDISLDEKRLLITTESAVLIAHRDEVERHFDVPMQIFIGEFESARFGGSDHAIALVDVSGPSRDLAISMSP